MALRIGAWTAILLAIVLIMLAIAETVVSKVSINFGEDRIRNPFRIRDPPDSISEIAYGWIYNIPLGMRYRELYAIFAISIAIGAAMVFLLIGVFTPVHATRPHFGSLPLLSSLVPAIGAPIAFVYSMVKYYQSSSFDADEFLASQSAEYPGVNYGPDAIGDRRMESWSWEAWVCQTEVVWRTKTDINGYGEICRLAATSRWLTIPLVLLSWTLFILVVLQFRKGPKSHDRESKGETELFPVDSREARTP